MSIKAPKVVKPVMKQEADAALDEGKAAAQGSKRKGQESLVSAGRLKKKAFTIKASLLGE